MESTNNKLKVLIVGATGHLGCLMTKRCLEKPNLNVSVLIRDPNKNKELVNSVEKSGGKVFKGDLTQPESLNEPTKGMHTVICVINSYDDKIAVDGQIALLKECLKNGVQRFVPSDFGMNYTEFSREELNRSAIVSPKIKFQDYLNTTSIKKLRFWQGIIAEMFINLQQQGFGYWGDKSFPMDITCYDDIARLVAHAVSKPDLAGEFVYVANKLTLSQITDIYNKVRGTNLQPKKFGSSADLMKAYEEKRKQGDFQAEVLGLYLITTDERSTFKKTNNDDFPEIKPTTFEEFLKKNPDLKIPS